ncbi:MAG: O-antigen ligase family protein [Methylococcales bacterium]
MIHSVNQNQTRILGIISNLQFFCLCLLALTLPLLEAPKNIAYVLYLIVWTVRLSLFGTDGIKTGPYDLILAVFVGGNLITSLGAFIKGFSISGISDILRYSLIGWMLLHTSLSNRRVYIILSLLLLSTVMGIGWGYWDLSRGNTEFFELHSVGHVNHSSIFILLIIGSMLPFLFFRKLNLWKYILVGSIFLVLFGALLETDSRATIIGFVFILIFYVGMAVMHHRKLAILTLALIIGFGGYSVWTPPKVFYKFQSRAHEFENQLTPREKIWNVAWLAWKKEPIFGIGYRNYKDLNANRVQNWYRESGRNFSDDSKYLYTTHAHNRYLNTLVEGGVVGLFSLLFLFVGVGFVLWDKRAIVLKPGCGMTAWLVGFYTLASTVVVGLFNTTLHHEHAILAMILLVLSYKQFSSECARKKHL